MGHYSLSVLLSATCLLFGPFSSRAETAPAVLSGAVVARRSQTRVPGAQVILESASNRFQSMTDEAGAYRFERVPPGTNYKIRVESSGFGPVVRQNVNLAAGESRTENFELDIQEIHQSVQVSGSAEGIGSVAPVVSRTVASSDIKDLPSNGRSLVRYALLNPHVRQTQGLGSDGAAASRLSINAASFRHTSHAVDGASNYDSVFANAPQQAVPASAVQETAVLTGPYSAEYGGSTAGVVRATTRSGTDAFHGEAFGFLRPSGVQAKPPVSSLRTPNERIQVGAAAGGPFVRNQTQYFAAFEGSDQRRGSFIQSPAPLTFTGVLKEWTALARVDHRATERNQISFRLNGQHSQNNNANDRIGGFTQPSAEQSAYTQAVAAQLTDRAVYGRAVNEFRASYSAYTPSATRTTRPAVSIVRPSYSTEGGSANSWVHVRAAQISDVVGVQHGSHEIRAGLDFQRVTAKDYSFTPFGEYRFAPGPSTAGQQPLQYTQTFGQAMLRYGQSYSSAFVQDSWRALPTLTATAGLRYERQSITNDTVNLAPRLGLAWDVGGRGKTVVRGAAGIYYDQYYFYIVRRFFLQGVNSPTATYTIPFGAPGFPDFPNSLALAPGALQSGKRDLYLPAAHLLNPYSFQSSIGLRQEIGDGWSISADVLHTRTLKQMRANDINAPAPFVRSAASQRRTVAQADATRPFATYAGLPVRNVLVIENSGASSYDALDLGVARQFARVGQFQAHYVYASSSSYAMFFGEPNTGVPNDWGNTGSAERGPSDFHQRHRLVATSVLDLPRGTMLSVVASLGSGLPVNPLTGLDNNGDTFTSDRPVGMGRNSFRGPAHATVDAAGSKRVKITEHVGLEMRLEVFNLLNRNNYIKLNGIYGDGTGPGTAFLQPVAGLANVDPSRQLQTGLRLIW